VNAKTRHLSGDHHKPAEEPAKGRLYRLGGEWICEPCDELVTDRVSVGGGMPIGNWLPRMFPRLFGRQEKVRREGACGTCGQAGWYLE
jgi:hypothetical protein